MNVLREFWRTVAGTLRRLMRGQDTLVSQPVYVERMRKCFRCPYRQPGVSAVVCSRCKCVMVLKARLVASRCPEGFWYA